MNFGLAIDISVEVNNKIDIIQSLSDDLEHYFKNKNYGRDIKSFTIGIVCLSPQFDQFFKERKPKYTRGKKEIIQYGIPFTLEDSLEYSVKIDFESFKNANEKMVKKLLMDEILSSLSILEKMKFKFQNFDLVRFKSDLEKYSIE